MTKSMQVFVSYSLRDQEWAQRFVDELTKKGVNVWSAEKELPVGESIADRIEEQLRSSDIFVFLVGPDSIHSLNLAFELGAALGMGKRVIAIVAKEVQQSDLPGPIKLRRYLPMEDPWWTANEVYPLVMEE